MANVELVPVRFVLNGRAVEVEVGAREMFAVAFVEQGAKLGEVAHVGAQRLRRDPPLILEVGKKSRNGAIVGARLFHSARSAIAPTPSASIHAVRDAIAFADRAARRSCFLLDRDGASGRRPNAAFCGW